MVFPLFFAPIFTLLGGTSRTGLCTTGLLAIASEVLAALVSPEIVTVKD